MEFLPTEMQGTIYYRPSSNGMEQRIKEWLDKRRKNREKKKTGEENESG
jgi:replication-associated recombination protein RarA